MQRPSRPEIIGIALLGIALLLLAISLRATQPGLLSLPPYACPAGAAAVYLVAALLLAGFNIQWPIVFILMAAAHVIYAFIMGCAFASLAGEPPQLSPEPLLEGLAAYPPATLLQIAFVLPLVSVLAWPWLPRAAGVPGFECEALDNARSPEELLRAMLALEAVPGDQAEAALARAATRARMILDGQASSPVDAEEREMNDAEDS